MSHGVPTGPLRSFSLEVSIGKVPGYAAVNVFGASTDCDNGVPTDVWDGADGVTSTDIWIPPTTARIHDIASTSTADDGSPVGTGMRTVRVFGLTSWSTPEVNEIVTLNGTTNVPTANSYVIINKLKGLTFGSGGTNAGIVTATAQTDATVTAAILAGEGHTLMAIYGFPSVQTLHATDARSEVVSNSPSEVILTTLIRERADQADSAFITQGKFHIADDSPFGREFVVPQAFVGPAILKIQALSNANNAIVTAAFDAYLVDN